MNWRPEGWKNPHSGKAPELVFPQCCIMLEEGAFEAGADAMLEALERQCTSVTLEPNCSLSLVCIIPNVPIKMIPAGGFFQKGVLVFIPEAENV